MNPSPDEASTAVVDVVFPLTGGTLGEDHVCALSLAVQETGLGGHHLLGCGIFIPHKSVAAVGD